MLKHMPRYLSEHLKLGAHVWRCWNLGTETWFKSKVAKLHIKSRNILRYYSNFGITNTKKPDSRGCSNIKANVPFVMFVLYWLGFVAGISKNPPFWISRNMSPTWDYCSFTIVCTESHTSAPNISSYRLHVCSIIIVLVPSFSDQPSITAQPNANSCVFVAKPWMSHAIGAGALDLILK